MLNMNSPVVQNIVNNGFNPYNNSGYIPPQPPIYQQTYYNPYVTNIQQPQQEQIVYYDPMPQIITNEARNIHSVMPVQQGNINPAMMAFNQQMFNGYVNPYLMKNQMEANRIKQREEAIRQGKMWRILMSGLAAEDPDFDIDAAVKNVESMYYQEPITQNIPIKDKIIIDKNNHFAQLEAKLEYCRNNNIPIIDNNYRLRQNICNYYNHVNSIIGEPENCDMVDYFTRVYPQLKQEQLEWEAERYSRNLKNAYNSKMYNQLLDQHSKPDSFYSKLMNTFSESGVRLTDGNGLTITPDEMEIKMPEKLIRSNQSKYMEQKRKFYESVFRKE